MCEQSPDPCGVVKVCLAVAPQEPDGESREEPEEHKRLCSIHRTRIFSISNDSRQDHGYHLQNAWLRWISSGRSICFYPSKNGGCFQISENSQIGMSRHLDSSTTTQYGQNHGPVWKTQSFLLSEIGTVTLGRTVMGRQVEKILLQHGWEKVSNWKCLFIHRE